MVLSSDEYSNCALVRRPHPLCPQHTVIRLFAHCVTVPRIRLPILCAFLLALFYPVVIPARGAEQDDGIPKFIFISEFVVHGVHSMTSIEIQKTVYRFLGPNRLSGDIQAACTAIEKAYQAKGYGAASVQAGGFDEKTGIVELSVNEGSVGRLRVKGARYFSPEKIKEQAPALAEGKVVNFNDINHDLVALNQTQDRTVTPTLKPGAEPGTYDVDLQVKDSRPLHASVELNDANSPNTKPLRVVGSISDSNLGQSGQGAGLTFQEAPQRRKDSEVFSGYYTFKVPGNDRWSVLLLGTKQDSNISTLGGTTVAGPGQTFTLQSNYLLPNGKDWDTGTDWADFTHSFGLSLNYKHFRQSLNIPSTSTTATASSAGTLVTPITYYPITADYTATWNNSAGKGSSTTLETAVTFNFRGLGGGPNEFDLNRYGADGSFIDFRTDISQTQPLFGGFEMYARIHGQVSNQPLVSSEEITGGGEQSVRGYLESEVVGDDGIFGTVEFRSPAILFRGKKYGDFRVFVFGDGGELKLIDPLPDQTAHFSLASAGVGGRVTVFDHLSGSCYLAYPFIAQAYTEAHDLQLRFHVQLDY